MLSYSLKCRKHTESKDPEVVKTKKGRIVLLSKCEVCFGSELVFNCDSWTIEGFSRVYFVLKWF